MASTNKTTHYDLSQYVSSDKPTYLVDYNGDMSKIDTAIYGADSRSLTNESAIGDLTNLNTTAKNNLVSAVNELKGVNDTQTDNISTNTNNIATNTGAIGVLANLNTTAKNNLVNAVNEVNTKANGTISELNFTHFDSFDTSNVTATEGSLALCTLTVASNESGSLFKLYGEAILLNTNMTSGSLTFQTRLRPDNDTTISCSGLITYLASGLQYVYNAPTSFTLSTTGLITINNLGSSFASVEQLRIVLYPCLFFAKDFGDTPVTPPSN